MSIWFHFLGQQNISKNQNEILEYIKFEKSNIELSFDFYKQEIQNIISKKNYQQNFYKCVAKHRYSSSNWKLEEQKMWVDSVYKNVLKLSYILENDNKLINPERLCVIFINDFVVIQGPTIDFMNKNPFLINDNIKNGYLNIARNIVKFSKGMELILTSELIVPLDAEDYSYSDIKKRSNEQIIKNKTNIKSYYEEVYYEQIN